MATKKLSAFEQAFASARKAGDKTFEFGGKKYTTKRADDPQESVGGTPKMGEYVRRDMGRRMAEIDRETRGDDMALRYQPRRTPKPLSEVTRPGTRVTYDNETNETFKKGGMVKSRGDGCAQRGKTKGTMR